MPRMAYIDLDNLRSVFLDDAALQQRRLSRRRAGMLQITSGRIVACDPLVQPERPAFARALAQRGGHAVDVILGSVPALAVLWLRERAGLDAAALHWAPALLDGESVDMLADDAFYGYPVDAGMGCFMDAQTGPAIGERDSLESAAPGYVSYYDDVLAPELGESDMADHYPLGQGSANNVVVFRSGWGDGSYPSFWALDAAGEPVALVTDFLTIEGGDARDADDRRGEAYLAGLSSEKIAALEALGDAAERGDADAVRSLLAAGVAGANEIVPSSGETAISSAIRRDRTTALRVLLGNGPCPPMPEELHMKGVTSYPAYARFFRTPRDPALLAVLDAAQQRAQGRAPASTSPASRSAAPSKPFWKRWLP